MQTYSSDPAPVRRALAALALALLVPAPAPAREVDARAVDGLVGQALKAWRVPGVAVAIVRGDDVVYLKGHGLREVGGKAPVTPDTLFPIASCTKGFTATAMAVLVDEGKLAWDDPVRKHVPFFRLADPLADREVRLRDLVCHRTGLAGHDMLWYRAPWTQEEAIRRAGKLPLDRPFRSAFQYQSTMFAAAGYAVQSAARTPWSDFVHQRLLDPLGMRATVFTSTAAARSADRAGPHRLDGSGRAQVIPYYPMETPDPAGSIHAGARDLAKWVRFHLGDGTVGGRRLVSTASLRETHTPQMAIPLEESEHSLHPDTVQLSYGMGWVVHDYRGHGLVSHAGAIDGFRAHFTLVPRAKLGIVLLNNLDRTQMNLALCNSLLDLLLGLPRKDWNALMGRAVRKEAAAAAERERARLARRHQGTTPSRELAAYAGAYEHPAYGTVRVALERGALVWRWNDWHGTLEHFHYDTFTLPLDSLGRPQVVFALDADGLVARMKVGGNLNVEFRKPGRKPARGVTEP
jgi:CubicO group peptidase (beta-lactamase class C family)